MSKKEIEEKFILIFRNSLEQLDVLHCNFLIWVGTLMCSLVYRKFNQSHLPNELYFVLAGWALMTTSASFVLLIYFLLNYTKPSTICWLIIFSYFFVYPF